MLSCETAVAGRSFSSVECAAKGRRGDGQNGLMEENGEDGGRRRREMRKGRYLKDVCTGRSWGGGASKQHTRILSDTLMKGEEKGSKNLQTSF